MTAFEKVKYGAFFPSEGKKISQKEEGKVTTGAGIGLALSRSLAELHRGTLVMVQGEEANIFRLTLPITQDMVIALDSDVENKDAELQAETSGESYPDDKLEGKHSTIRKCSLSSNVSYRLNML